MTCPLIKIRLAKGQTLGAAALVRPGRDEPAAAWEPKAEPRTANQSSGEAIRATYVEQDGRREARGQGMVTWPAWTKSGAEAPNVLVLGEDRTELRRYLADDARKSGTNVFEQIVPADVAAIEVHKGSGCAPLGCPQVTVIIKRGREAPYKQR